MLDVLSAQDQSKYTVRTTTDEHGEQKINKDAKTTGQYETVHICEKHLQKGDILSKDTGG